MADLTGSRVAVACNNSGGCPHPCSAGAACRCAAEGGEDQRKCLSGNNCGSKAPCACGPPVAAAENGQFYCRCGPGCTCSTSWGA